MIRPALAWMFYGLGWIVYKIEDNLTGRWEWSSLYPLYNWLMGRSEAFQGESDRGPWRKAESVE